MNLHYEKKSLRLLDGDGLNVIWSQVIWGQGWGPGQGMNLNNVSPQTPVIGIRLCNLIHKRKLKVTSAPHKFLPPLLFVISF